MAALTVDIPWTRCPSGRMVKASPPSLIPVERVASRLSLMRHQKVVLDFDLAALYGIPTKAFNQAVTRNAARFPEDFLFRLSREEAAARHRSHMVTGAQKHRDPRLTPRAFTQEGVTMLSGVLRSKRAVEINVAIMRAFVRLREILVLSPVGKSARTASEKVNQGHRSKS